MCLLTIIMKKTILLVAILSVFIGVSQQSKRQLLQLKIYTFANKAQQQITENYLEKAYLPALHRLQIKNIGVFKTHKTVDSIGQKLYVLTPYDSLMQLKELENNILNDEDYKMAGKTYLQVSHDKPPYQRIETILLCAFKNMPRLKPTPIDGTLTKRIYELRSYQSPNETYLHNKVDMFNVGGEIALFKSLNFNAVFYGEVISGPDMPNLMYMTTFSNQESRDIHWKAFVDSPEWKKLSANAKYQNNVSHIDITFLYPTEYSDY